MLQAAEWVLVHVEVPYLLWQIDLKVAGEWAEPKIKPKKLHLSNMPQSRNQICTLFRNHFKKISSLLESEWSELQITFILKI